MLIDFHTHAFPEKIASRAISALEQNIRDISGDGPWAYAIHNGTVGALLDVAKKSGVDISVVMPIATTPTQLQSINRFALEVNSYDKLFSFGSIHPMQPDWESELNSIAESGLKGIKLHPEYQGFYINSPESIRVLKLAEKLGLYVVLHAGEDAGMMPPYHCTPELLADALESVSGKNIIAAHMGGYKRWEEVLKFLVGKPLLFDTSCCLSWMPKDLACEIIKQHTADKILFGSDSPWKSPATILDALKGFGLSDSDFDKITHKNAAKILEI